jgi:hypothetical protein
LVKPERSTTRAMEVTDRTTGRLACWANERDEDAPVMLERAGGQALIPFSTST